MPSKDRFRTGEKIEPKTRRAIIKVSTANFKDYFDRFNYTSQYFEEEIEGNTLPMPQISVFFK